MADSPRAASPATITVLVPGPLRDCCNGSSELRIAAADVSGALAQIETLHPSLYRSVCDETGAVRRHLNLFVNSTNIRDLDGVETGLAADDALIILPAVSGG